MALIHGGQLNNIAKYYQIPSEQWLDLSTGISPLSYPIPKIPMAVWQQLPQNSPELITAATTYYGCKNIMATSGSQSIISKLPLLCSQHLGNQLKVWLPEVGYKEHEKAWRENGYQICHYHELPQPQHLTSQCVVIVINPNNPSGKLYNKELLSDLLACIEILGGWLVIDEAFMDVISPSQSLIAQTTNQQLFVLRSVGKFFGLAGIRLGFVSAAPVWLERLNALSSPWEVNGPAQFIATQALQDQYWQNKQQTNLQRLSNELEYLLQQYFCSTITGTTLFKTVKLVNAKNVFEQLCRCGVYVRLCDEQNALRFGLATDSDMNKLKGALANLNAG